MSDQLDGYELALAELRHIVDTEALSDDLSGVERAIEIIEMHTAGLPEPQEAVTIRPGQTLIVRVPVNSDHRAVRALADSFKERLPGVEVAVVACDGIAVYKPNTAEEAS